MTLFGFEITTEVMMVGVGFLGQALFSARFLVQWVKSEMSRKSVIPIAFWYFSIAGGTVLFTYALWREDPVFIAGQGAGLIIYGRNLWLIYKERRLEASSADQQNPAEKT